MPVLIPGGPEVAYRIPALGTQAELVVAAASCVEANTASTAAMVKGPAAMAWLAARNLPSRLVEWDGTVSCIADWPIDTPSLVEDGVR